MAGHIPMTLERIKEKPFDLTRESVRQIKEEAIRRLTTPQGAKNPLKHILWLTQQ